MTDTTPAPIGEDALREALWICVEHNALHFGETHNTVVQGRAALASAAQPPALTGDLAEPRDDSDRVYDRPVGYLPAYELSRLHAGHGAQLRSAKFGPSALDGDVPVYLESSALALRNDALDSFGGIIGDEMEPAQPEQTPLTREQIDEFFPIGMGPYHTIVGEHNILKFVRKIEAAHGIKPAKEDKP